MGPSELKLASMKQSETSLLEREEKIRRRAHELYVERNRGDGHDVEDWPQAEAEIHLQEVAAKATAA